MGKDPSQDNPSQEQPASLPDTPYLRSALRMTVRSRKPTQGRPPSQAVEVARALCREYPDATCSLDFASPLELLVATILSAQCTDKRVNLVTKDLFAKYRSAADYAQARPTQLQRDIKSTGFYRNKAKNLRDCCQILVDEHDGQIPEELDALVKLPGIGRKTANVVLGTAFGVATGVAVDTHVGRLSRRLGLSENKDPSKVEQDLIEKLPEKEWIAFSHRMIQHGRQVCTARKPRCDECPLESLCPRVGVEEA